MLQNNYHDGTAGAASRAKDSVYHCSCCRFEERALSADQLTFDQSLGGRVVRAIGKACHVSGYRFCGRGFSAGNVEPREASDLRAGSGFLTLGAGTTLRGEPSFGGALPGIPSIG